VKDKSKPDECSDGDDYENKGNICEEMIEILPNKIAEL
jgi:hypothetical protein